MRDYPVQLIDSPEVDEITESTTDDGEDSSAKVVIHNDDTTPMDFVLYILLDVFKRPHIMAEAIMWEAHEQGNSIVGAWSKKVAEMKVRQAHFRARLKGFPLLFTIEQD